MIRPPAKQSGIEQAFSETTKQQELGVAVHVPAKSGIWMIFSATSKKAKKSTVLQTKYSAFLVENSGIEPLTSCMPCKRSPEPRTHAPPHKVARMNNIRCKNVKIEEITSVSPLERLL